MDGRQNSKLNMAQQVSDVLVKKSSVYAHILPMVDAVNELGTKVGDIREAAKEQKSTNVPAATQDKRKVEGRMIDLSVKVGNVLYVVGFIAGNTELTGLLGLNPNNYYDVEDNTKISIAKHLYDQARAHAGELQAYGYGDAEIDAIGKAIDAYNALIAKPKGTIGARKQKTTNLKQLFAELDSILYDKLDKLMTLFKDSHPDFYNEYRTARNLINSSARHAKTDTPPAKKE